jgi:hypothetical protein
MHTNSLNPYPRLHTFFKHTFFKHLQTEQKSKAEKAAEDAYWRAQGEGAKSKAAAKKEEEEKKRLEQLAKKAELKRLQEEEEAALSKPKANPKANRVTGSKVGCCGCWQPSSCNLRAGTRGWVGGGGGRGGVGDGVVAATSAGGFSSCTHA